MRRLLATATTLVVAVTLTGCMKVDAAIEVHEDSTISGEMTMGVSKAMKEMMESFATEFGEDMETAPDGDSDADSGSDGFDDDFFEADDIPEGATVEPYEDDKFIGQTMKFEGITIEELNTSSGDTDSSGDAASDEWTIVRDGDTFVFNAEGDFSNEDAEEAEDNPMAAGFNELFAEAELRIAITFPGDVIEATGEIDGRTVTWTPEFGDTITMHAVAKAESESILPGFLDSSSDEGGVSGVLVAVVGGVLVLLLAALGVLLAVRRKKAAAA